MKWQCMNCSMHHERSIYRRRTVLCSLAILCVVMLGACATTTTYNDLVPLQVTPVSTGHAIGGSVSVQALVRGIPTANMALTEPSIVIREWTDEAKFNDALKEAIIRKGLFSGFEENQPDYVLDVWAYLKIQGRGLQTPLFVMDSIWRLTRVKDGHVMVCDFVQASAESGRIITKTVDVARETIQNGLLALSDTSQNHMSAAPASIWPSMGLVVPEGLQRLKQNWSKLKVGLTLDEVNILLDTPTMTNPEKTHRIQPKNDYKATEVKYKNRTIYYEKVDSLNNIEGFVKEDDYKVYTQMRRDNRPTVDGYVYKEEEVKASDFLTARITDTDGSVKEEYVTGAYTLTFINGKLKQRRLRSAETPVRLSSSPRALQQELKRRRAGGIEETGADKRQRQ